MSTATTCPYLALVGLGGGEGDRAERGPVWTFAIGRMDQICTKLTLFRKAVNEGQMRQKVRFVAVGGNYSASRAGRLQKTGDCSLHSNKNGAPQHGFGTQGAQAHGHNREFTSF